MAKTLAEFGTYRTPALKMERKKRICASVQALEVLKKKDVDVKELTEALQELCERMDIIWCGISKQCFTVSIDVVFRQKL